jgi:starch synthase
LYSGSVGSLSCGGTRWRSCCPKYDCLRYDRIYGLTVAYDDLWVPWFDGAIHCTVWFGWVEGRKCFFVEPHSEERFFGRGHVYGSADDVSRFAFFSRAALEFMLKSGKRPEIIHCHDWETALVPVLLFEIYQSLGMEDQRVCLTVHNFRHQGNTSDWVLGAVGLTDRARFFDRGRLQDDLDPLALNLLKGGIVYSNFVTTVSPRHAWEARYTDQGAGLGHTLHVHRDKFGGILNGVDYDTWNPEVDPWIPQRYSAATIDYKDVNTGVLRERFMLRDEHRPVVAYVGRLDHQKGLRLIHHAIFYALARGAQFVLLGAGSDAEIASHFWQLKRHLNDHPDVHLELRFDHELAHLLYAGADLVVMPSLFEPCGLVQQVAVKYGTVPVARAIGGVVDTVFDHHYSSAPLEQRNGFVFEHVDQPALESALARAISLWQREPSQFRQLRLNGMRADRSWATPGRQYLDVYDYIRHKDGPSRQPELDSGAAAGLNGRGSKQVRSRGSRHAVAPPHGEDRLSNYGTVRTTPETLEPAGVSGD